mmetsp:Transcript_20816/g.42759  ORF Transcript_20816/g.42759 Transcript_20816/m.42759 type:complete len:696 (-) Transcript_20816:848-2935(-)
MRPPRSRHRSVPLRMKEIDVEADAIGNGATTTTAAVPEGVVRGRQAEEVLIGQVSMDRQGHLGGLGGGSGRAMAGMGKSRDAGGHAAGVGSSRASEAVSPRDPFRGILHPDDFFFFLVGIVVIAIVVIIIMIIGIVVPLIFLVVVVVAFARTVPPSVPKRKLGRMRERMASRSADRVEGRCIATVIPMMIERTTPMRMATVFHVVRHVGQRRRRGCVRADGNALLPLPKEGFFLDVGQRQRRRGMQRLRIIRFHGEGETIAAIATARGWMPPREVLESVDAESFGEEIVIIEATNAMVAIASPVLEGASLPKRRGRRRRRRRFEAVAIERVEFRLVVVFVGGIAGFLSSSFSSSGGAAPSPRPVHVGVTLLVLHSPHLPRRRRDHHRLSDLQPHPPLDGPVRRILPAGAAVPPTARPLRQGIQRHAPLQVQRRQLPRVAVLALRPRQVHLLGAAEGVAPRPSEDVAAGPVGGAAGGGEAGEVAGGGEGGDGVEGVLGEGGEGHGRTGGGDGGRGGIVGGAGGGLEGAKAPGARRSGRRGEGRRMGAVEFEFPFLVVAMMIIVVRFVANSFFFLFVVVIVDDDVVQNFVFHCVNHFRGRGGIRNSTRSRGLVIEVIVLVRAKGCAETCKIFADGTTWTDARRRRLRFRTGYDGFDLIGFRMYTFLALSGDRRALCNVFVGRNVRRCKGSSFGFFRR